MPPEQAFSRSFGHGAGPHDAGQPARSLLVLGASARAWAGSAARTGLRIEAADLFADRDLLAVAAAVAIPPERYPAALAEAALRFPAGPWCYTGALENHPGLVDAIAAGRPLAGNGGDAIRRVRSDRELTEAMAAAGIAFPRTLDDPATVPRDGSWLRKPRASGGGQGISAWIGPSSVGARRDSPGDHVWQERCAGVSVAGVFIVTPRGARLVGASRQLIGETAWNTPPYAYCGSIDVDPRTLSHELAGAWDRVGGLLSGAFGLRGAVGVDAIVTPAGRLVVIEINPRPTASMELIDRRTGKSLAADHLTACGFATGPCTSAPSGGRWAKGILRTDAAIDVDDGLCDRLDALSSAWSGADGWPAIADLPRSGTVVPAGGPCLTLFAVADTGRRARRLLDDRMAVVAEVLGRP